MDLVQKIIIKKRRITCHEILNENGCNAFKSNADKPLLYLLYAEVQVQG